MGKYSRYIITSDESIKKGKLYSYFFGGCLVKESEYDKINDLLNMYKTSLGFNEIKRSKITRLNAPEYIKILDLFFTFVKSGQIKVRIMYAPNNELNHFRHGQDEIYCKFYYTFLKLAFSIFYAKENIVLRLILDELPESPTVRTNFKNGLVKNFYKISQNNNSKVIIYKNRIQEANSKEHTILQCVDIIIGVIEFYLNHSGEPQTIKGEAKLKIFNHIYENYIKYFIPNFSFLKSTGYFNCYKSWLAPYKHLVFRKIKAPGLTT